MSRYGRYGGGKQLGSSEGLCRGCSGDYEAMGLARQLGDGYSRVRNGGLGTRHTKLEAAGAGY